MVEGAEAQRVHDGDRPSTHGHDVADDPADPGGRALVGLDITGVVVRLDLEGDRPAVTDVDDAGVLADPDEHLGFHLLGEIFREVAEMHLGGLVGAVLGPHHRVHRQFAAGGPTSEDLPDLVVLLVGKPQLAVGQLPVRGRPGLLDGVEHRTFTSSGRRDHLGVLPVFVRGPEIRMLVFHVRLPPCSEGRR